MPRQKVEFHPDQQDKITHLILSSAEGSPDVGVKVFWKKCTNRHDVGGHGLVGIKRVEALHAEMRNYVRNPPVGYRGSVPPFEFNLIIKKWFRLTRNIHGDEGPETFHGTDYPLDFNVYYDDARRLEKHLADTLQYITGWPP